MAFNNSNRDFWILALCGGGYRGLFTAKILANLEKQVGKGQCLADKFDLITGSSVGSILAAAVAKRIPATTLPDLFVKDGPTIFGGVWKHWPVVKHLNLGFLSARYSSKGLRKVLARTELLGDTQFGDLKHRLMIPTVNLTKGSAQFFKTQHHPEYRFDGNVPLIEACMASAAAPTYFPVHRFNNQRYADGGLVANSPAFVGYHEARFKLNVPLERIHVMTIGTMNKAQTISPSAPLNIGLITGIGWGFWKGWQEQLLSFTLTAQENLSNKMLEHVLEKRVLMIDEPLENNQAKSIAMDGVTRDATEALLGRASAASQRCMTGELFRKWLDHRADTPTFHNL